MINTKRSTESGMNRRQRLHRCAAIRPAIAGIGILAASIGLTSPAQAQAASAQGGGTPARITAQTSKCAGLVGFHFGPAIVNSAEIVPAKGKKAEYCKVMAYRAGKPVSKMWAFLPTSWEGAMLHVGFGGFKGRLRTDDEIWNASSPLEQGMIFVSGNGGNDDPTGMKLADPENMRDYVYANIGQVYDFGTAVAKAYYSTAPAKNYFIGCSAGGQEGFQAASIYSQNYDGIISQASPPSRVGWIARMGPLNTLTRLTTTQWSSIYARFIDECDAVDGFKDRIVSLPGACKFDPTKGSWTPGELATIKFVYNDVLAPDGTLLARRSGYGLSRFMVMERYADVWGKTLFARNEPNYDPAKFELAKYLPQMIAATEQLGFNLDPIAIGGFLKRGGKLVIQHGLDDGGTAPATTRDFADRIRVASGDAAGNLQVQFFPGVGHCGNRMPPVPAEDKEETAAYLSKWAARGGSDDLGKLFPGADKIETVGYLRQWVETGKIPQGQIASRKADDGTVLMTRPVCQSGTYASYTGRGDKTRAESYRCVAHPDAL